MKRILTLPIILILSLAMAPLALNGVTPKNDYPSIKILVTPVRTNAAADHNQKTIAGCIIIGSNGSGVRRNTYIEQRETVLKIIETVPQEDDQQLAVTFALHYKNEAPLPQTITMSYGSSVALEAINNVRYCLTLPKP
jgi:hypothetical protein